MQCAVYSITRFVGGGKAVATEAMAVGGRTDAGRIGRGDRHGKGCESVGPRKAGLGRVAER